MDSELEYTVIIIIIIIQEVNFIHSMLLGLVFVFVPESKFITET